MTMTPAWILLLADAVNARDRAVAERDALAAENRRLREQLATMTAERPVG